MQPKESPYGYWRKDKPKEPGYSHEYISADFKMFEGPDNGLDQLNSWPFEGVDTVVKAFERNRQRIPQHPIMGTKVPTGNEETPWKYEWMTLTQVLDTAKQLAVGMMSFGMLPEIEGEGKMWRFLGVQSKNRKEWFLLHIANMYLRATTVALYDTLGEDAMKYVIDQTELITVAMSPDLVQGLCKHKKKDEAEETGMMRRLKYVIAFGEVDKEAAAAADEVGIEIVSFQTVIDEGKKGIAAYQWPEPVTSDVTMLSYTSGTTGNPKGVKLTHQMIVQTAGAMSKRTGSPLNENDIYISYLPAAHSFEQALFGMVAVYGLRQGFFGGDPRKMADDDLPYLQPTFFPSVPRLYNVFFAKLKEKFETTGGIAGWLMRKAIAAKLENYDADGSYTHCLYDRLVFSKVRQRLGGRVRLMLTGSAPIAADVMKFLKVCFCCDFLEGYGMTETAAGSVTQLPHDKQFGHVGGPVANVKIRLRDYPEAGYMHEDPAGKKNPQGEICFWGPSIMKGYYKNPEKTAECIEDGWLASGDIGEVRPDMTIKIIDRAKNIFKLQQGEYIAPEKLENVFVQSNWIAQCWVYGNSLQDYCICFAVVEPTALEEWAKQNGTTPEEAVNKDELKELVHKDMMGLATANKFNSLEKPKQLCLMAEPWTIENNLLTSTFKLKRHLMIDTWKTKIDELYALPQMNIKK